MSDRATDQVTEDGEDKVSPVVSALSPDGPAKEAAHVSGNEQLYKSRKSLTPSMLLVRFLIVVRVTLAVATLPGKGGKRGKREKERRRNCKNGATAKR